MLNKVKERFFPAPEEILLHLSQGNEVTKNSFKIFK